MEQAPYTLAQVLADEREKLFLGERTIGLALSGGGIRSATFSLGVLQALATERRLASFDYLSTVSGGGYIGSWLTAWIHRCGLRTVQEKLAHVGPSEGSGAPAAGEPAEVTWLRKYSSYLAPRVGLLSLDALTLITTWTRNFLLNLIILLSTLGLAFLLPLLLMLLAGWAMGHYSAFGFASGWAGLVFLFGIGYNLWHQGLPVQRRRNWLISAAGVGVTVVMPGVLAACFGAVWLLGGPDKTLDDVLRAAKYVAGLLAVLLLAWAATQGRRTSWGSVARQLPVFVLAGTGGALAATAALVSLYLAWVSWLDLRQAGNDAYIASLVAFGPSALLVAFGLGTTIFTGLVGRVFFERSREWWSRLNAWLFTVGAMWLAWGALSYFSLPVLRYAADHLGTWASVIGTGWIGTLLASVFLRTPEGVSRKAQVRVESALNAAAVVFIAGLLVVTAAATHWALLQAAGTEIAPERPAATPHTAYEMHLPGEQGLARVDTPAQPPLVSLGAQLAAHFRSLEALERGPSRLGIPEPEALAIAGLLLVMLTFCWRVDINKFSLHNMYKNRLVRCYLGASNGDSRNEQPFTGLDDNDDIELRELVGTHVDDRGNEWIRAQRPHHLINAALNITQGRNLAWQERKAASFVFSSLYCGYALARTQGDSHAVDEPAWEAAAYRPTESFASQDREEIGFKLGMALATSGAAVSPNMGHASRPARAFVLTLFNVRLGRWTPNPARARWRSSSPRFGLIPLMLELLGQSNEERDYVYLSDGGHFDNLGVYELVRRRCTTIFAVDAGADPSRALGDLADTLRKCRIDLGVEIEFPDLKKLYGDQDMRAEAAFCRGVIRYDPNDRSRDGTIVLLKPTMGRGRTEPADVQHYAEENKPFPQQTTADQFFDESQFESYRRLGFLIGKECLQEHRNLLPPVEPRSLKDRRSAAKEAPTGVTRFIHAVLGRGHTAQPPRRDGSLVDYFVVTFFGVLAALAGFAAFDRFALGIHTGLCWTPAGCAESVGSLLKASERGLTVRTFLDNAFVVLYLGMFATGFLIAYQELRDGAWRNAALRFAACVILAVMAALGVVDYAENFAVLETVRGVVTERSIPPIAALTATKFALTAACALGLVACSPSIVRRFRRRWFPPAPAAAVPPQSHPR